MLLFNRYSDLVRQITSAAVLALPIICLGQGASIPIVSIQSTTQEINESGGGTGAFTVARTGATTAPLTVHYTVRGSASNGMDYARLPGVITIPAGQSSADIIVTPVDDRLPEDPEGISVHLAAETAPFTIAVLPDSQYYSAAYPAANQQRFLDQIQWIVANKDLRNIAFVLHEGDGTDANLSSEWQGFRANMRLLDGVVPYAIAVGNHDGLMTFESKTALFNSFFPVTNFQSLPTFGAVFESNRMDNCYHLFSAGGLDWLLLSLEFGPRNVVLDWANNVVSNFPNRRVMVVTHAYLNDDNTLLGSAPNQPLKPSDYGRENNGTDIWDKFVRRHANIAFVFNGHLLGTGQGRLVSVGDHGNRVYQMLCNYQMQPDGGSGFLRFITLYPDEDRLEANSYSPTLNRYLTDGENQFRYDNLGIFNNVCQSYAIDRSAASASMTILSDEIDTAAPNVVTVTAAGIPPEVTILFDEPVQRDTAEALANYDLGDVPITNAVLLSDRRTVVLSCGNTLLPTSNYTLSVSGVTDSSQQANQMATPVARSFSYQPVLLDLGFNDPSFENWSIVDEGTVNGPSVWSISQGRMFQYSNIHSPAGTNSPRPGTFVVWNKPSAQGWTDYAVSMSLRSLDDDGVGLMFRYSNRSNYYKVDLDSQRNFRRLSKKVNGVESTLAIEAGQYQPNRDFKLRVTAYGNELTVFVDGAPVFGGPVIDSDLSQGTLALFCYANAGTIFDDLLVTPSNGIPEVSISAPAEGQAFPFQTNVPILANASDIEGIAQVEFFVNNTLSKVKTNAPYSVTLNSPVSGRYSVFARATDRWGAVGVSPVVHFQVNPPPPSFVKQPDSQTVPPGTNVFFRARADASGLQYQWFFNGTPVPLATNSVLFVNGVNASNAGSYSLVVQSPWGTATSSVAVLNVLGDPVPPKFVTNTSLSVVEAADPGIAVFSVEAPLGLIAIECSTNLAQWFPLMIVTNTTGGVFFDDTTQPRCRFYRATPVAR